MANFMGPMAPPQAAPNAPPQLDIRTNPSQRAQFKEFMQGMNRPVMPPTTAPIAPMLPAPMPSPMDQIDIFAPAPMADGGVVGGLQDLGQMSDQMVEALNTVVYGGEPGGGFGGGVSSGGGFGGGNMPPPLPGFDMSFFDPERPGYLEQRFERVALPIGSSGLGQFINTKTTAPMQTPPSSLPFAQPLSARDAYAQAQADARRQRDDGFMGRVVLPGEMPFDQFAEGYNFRLNNPMQPLQTLANGGGVGSYFEDIPTASGPKMAGGTTNVIDASGSNTGGGSSDPISSMDLYDVAMANPPLPITGTSALISALDASMSMHNQRTDREDAKRASMGNALRASTPMAKMRDFASGILSATQMDGPMGSTIGIRPVARDGNLGIMANFSLPFEDGGPVGMFLGGDPQAYGEERGRQDTSETAQERQRVGGTTNVFEGDSSPREERDETERRVNEAVAAAQQMEAAQQLRDDIIASESPVNVFPGSSMRGEPVESTAATDTDEFFSGQNMARDQRLDDAVKSILAVDKTEQFDDLLGDVFVDPLVSPQSPNPQPRETDPINPLGQLMAGDVVYNRGKDNERTVSRFADLENRMGIKDARVNKGQGLSALAEPILSKVASALGGSKATDIFDNVVNQNKQAIIAADTNQIVGYADDGPFGRVYTGRPGYNPFGPDGSSYTVDPQTGALIVNRQQPNQSDDDERASGQTPATPPPATDPADTAPPPLMITPPTTGFPPSVPDPTDVLVPSTRRDIPVTVPSILPTQGLAPTFLPQSFLDLLASFNRPAPRAMQDGGAVLDKAADDFLEALKVA